MAEKLYTTIIIWFDYIDGFKNFNSEIILSTCEYTYAQLSNAEFLETHSMAFYDYDNRDEIKKLFFKSSLQEPLVEISRNHEMFNKIRKEYETKKIYEDIVLSLKYYKIYIDNNSKKSFVIYIGENNLF